MLCKLEKPCEQNMKQTTNKITQIDTFDDHNPKSFYQDWFTWQQVMTLVEKNAAVRNAYNQLLVLCNLAEDNNE